jgi:hypothetical protein
MKQIEFKFEYAAAYFRQHEAALPSNDPVQLYRKVFDMLALTGAPNADAVEPGAWVKMKYTSDYQFTLKGQSFWLFQKFMENLSTWALSRPHQAKSRAQQQAEDLVNWALEQSKEDQLECDTDIAFKIKTYGVAGFQITVEGPRFLQQKIIIIG